MESVSWNPIVMIRRYRERRQRLREEELIVRNYMRTIRYEEEPIGCNPMRIIQRYRERHLIREEEERTVEIFHPRTRIRGVSRIMRRSPHHEYIAFLGIPYALPPIGKLRFQPPMKLPERPRNRASPLYLANNGYHPCAQKSSDDENMGSENCLYLNVFTPRKPKNIPELLPVLVYIHGGGFFGGQNDTIDPDEVMREDLVVVTINYRLGVFGFLNMRVENCRGNAGLKDQTMALEWVRDNIEEFRGDSRNVTICGQSAGGTCVNLHMLSPLSKGLFHKAIVMGGGVYCPWGYGGHAKHVKHLFRNAVGKSQELRLLAVETLKTMRTFQLMKLGYYIMDRYRIVLHPKKMMVPYKPSVEYVEEGAFLPKTLEKLMEEAQPVPTIAGITKQEGYMYFRTHTPDVIKLMKGKSKFVQLVKGIIRQNFSWKDPTAVERHFESLKAIYFPKKGLLEEVENMIEYENNEPATEEERRRKEEEKRLKEDEQKQHLATLITDIFFRRFYDNFNIGNLLNEGWPPFYVYEFDYFAGQPLFPMPTLNDDCHDDQPIIVSKGAEHADDLYFLFGPNYVTSVLHRTERKNYKRIHSEIRRVQTNMRNLWSSFCKSNDECPRSRVKGDANVNWLEHTEKDPQYLHIGKKLYLGSGHLNERRWPLLNAICQLESTIPSLQVSPQTPEKERKEFQPAQYKLKPSLLHTLAEEVEECKMTHL